MYTRTLDSGVLIWRTQPYSCSIGIICVSQLISMSTPGIWFKARGGRPKHHPGGRIPQFCSPEQPGVGEEPTQKEPNRYMLGPEQETQLLRGVQRHISTLRPSRHHPIGDPCSGWGQWSHELSRRKQRDVWGKSLAELGAHHTRSPPTTLRPSNLTASLAFIQSPPPTAFSQPSTAFQGFYPSQRSGLQLAVLVCQGHVSPLRTSTKTIRRNDLHFSLH